jgi:hypothetical protein
MRKKAGPLKKLPAGPLFKKANAVQVLAAALNPVAEIEQHNNYLLDRQADAWAGYALSGDTAYLADYIEHGGSIDGEFREALLNILRHGPPKRSKKDDWKCFETAVEIRTIMQIDGIKVTKARKKYAEMTGQTLDAIRKQHKVGKALLEKWGK